MGSARCPDSHPPVYTPRVCGQYRQLLGYPEYSRWYKIRATLPPAQSEYRLQRQTAQAAHTRDQDSSQNDIRHLAVAWPAIDMPELENPYQPVQPFCVGYDQ